MPVLLRAPALLWGTANTMCAMAEILGFSPHGKPA